MNFATLALVVAAIGVNFGWQPSPDNPQAYEVLMQVEPELVDVMADGREIPIESHVPASVSPIRNIRVVVGTEELPRTMIDGDRSQPKSDRVVRGQAPDPVQHTTNFQNDPWTDSRYDASGPANRQYEQRGATIGSQSTPAAASSPWTVENAQQQLNAMGNSVRSSVGSSIDEVDRQFDQFGRDLADKTQNVANEFGNQLQNLTGLGNQSPPASASPSTTARSWSTPPVTPSAQPVTPITPTWTSIRPELAPPRLTPPPLAGGVRVASNPTTSRTNVGPAFPAPPIATSTPERSLVTNSNAARQEEGDWTSPWSTDNTESDGNFSSVGMVPVPPRIGASTVGQNQTHTSPPPATNSSNITPVADSRHSMANESKPTSESGAADWANFGRGTNDLFNDPRLPDATSQASAAKSEPPERPFTGQRPMTQPTIGTQSKSVEQASHTTTDAAPDEVPWKPLLAVSLALAGSIGANFYLGMSYAEARHRYRALAAKTTHAFEKKAGLAA